MEARHDEKEALKSRLREAELKLLLFSRRQQRQPPLLPPPNPPQKQSKRPRVCSSSNGSTSTSHSQHGRCVVAASTRLPAATASTTSRHVSVPSAAFETTSNGMGLKRKESSSMSSSLVGAVAPKPTSVDFKRQRIADAARVAKGSVLCTFFCRHGRCDGRGGAECPYEHDPDRVAICQAFLHGACSAKACLLSHAPRAENMPTCRLFVRGVCVDSGCAFSHVHLGASAKICEAFARGGYCTDGAACARRHEMFCEQHAANGACTLGERCKLGLRRALRDSCGTVAQVPVG